MSFDYYLVVPAEKWPTFDQLQAALAADGSPITVVRPDGLLGDSPFLTDTKHDNFDFVYNQKNARLGGWFKAFEDDDFLILENTWEEELSHEVVDYSTKNDIPIKRGDMLAHIKYWDSDLAFGVWNLTCASFVRNFSSHYYDPQSGEVLDESALVAIGEQFCALADPVTEMERQTILESKPRGFFSRLFGKKD